jgi:predicted acylesterase/phospholipase RssA
MCHEAASPEGAGSLAVRCWSCIRPDLVVGTSDGAFVGAAYASGLRPAQLLAVARELRVASLIDFNPGGGGLMRGQHIAAGVDEWVAHKPIQRPCRLRPRCPASPHH